MINKQELKAAIVRKGLTQEQVSYLLGISSKTFYNKMKKGVFNTDEVMALIKELDIKNPMAIFFAK